MEIIVHYMLDNIEEGKCFTNYITALMLFISLTGWAQKPIDINMTVENVNTLQTNEYLLSTRWNQKEPFNDSCPQNTVAGCGAIAIAQIINHHKKPTAGFGHVHYVCANNIIVEENFSEHPFD